MTFWLITGTVFVAVFVLSCYILLTHQILGGCWLAYLARWIPRLHPHENLRLPESVGREILQEILSIGLKPCKMKIYRDVCNRPQWSWYLRPGHPFSSGQIPFLDDWIIGWIHQLNHQSTGFLEGAVGLTTCHKLLKPWCYDLHALGYKSCTCNYGFHSFDFTTSLSVTTSFVEW